MRVLKRADQSGNNAIITEFSQSNSSGTSDLEICVSQRKKERVERVRIG